MASYQPPPPYAEEEPQVRHASNQYRINRKPLSSTQSSTESNHQRKAVVYPKDGLGCQEEVIPRLPPRPGLSLDTAYLSNVKESELFSSPEQTRPSRADTFASTVSSSSATNSLASSSISSTSTISPSSTKSTFSKAYQEARHFAGGLIAHPFESTKHYTILRHSHGLVFYQGTSTSLALSIFADAPLPPDRTLWLQSKGWTGKTGMRAKSFMGIKGNWLDVTPTMAVGPDQLRATDERAWQRDLAQFQKKAKPEIRERHRLRETVILRIPAEAGDGYFQVVMCMGDNKKVLCHSPVFRLLSTSTSPNSIKGASLSTLPLELGAMVLSTYGRSTVGTAISPITSVVQNSVGRYMPGFWTRKVASIAYGASGVEGKVDNTISDANSRYDQTRDLEYTIAGPDETTLDQGPKSPYPIRFVGRSQPGEYGDHEESNIPSLTLGGVDDKVMERLHGFYFGWARLLESPISDENPWYQAIISSLPIDTTQLARANFKEASKRTITLHLITDADPFSSNLLFEVQILGFIRPDEPVQRATLAKGLRAGDEDAAEAAMLSEVNDLQMAQAYLDHPAWAPEITTREKEQMTRMEKVKTGYANTRAKAQKHIDRVPIHKLGIRAPIDAMKDKTVVNGFYIVRG